jgi:hypothetical protein
MIQAKESYGFTLERDEPEERQSFLSRQQRAQREEVLREPGFWWASHIGLRSRPGFIMSKPVKRAAHDRRLDSFATCFHSQSG